MKQSTPDQPKPKEPKSILLIGPPGGGKTTLMLQWPGLVVIDCDSNLDGPEHYLRKTRSLTLNYAYESVKYKDDGSPRPVEECFDFILDCLLRIKNDKEHQTVGVDSLTEVNEYIIQKVLKQQAKTLMEPHFWAPFKTYMRTLINRLRGSGKTSICTVHEVILTRCKTDSIMVEEVIGYKPSIQGGITDYFGAFFSDMWRCYTRLAPGGSEFVLMPLRTKESDLKNSVGLTKEIVNPTYEKLAPYLK